MQGWQRVFAFTFIFHLPPVARIWHTRTPATNSCAANCTQACWVCRQDGGKGCNITHSTAAGVPSVASNHSVGGQRASR